MKISHLRHNCIDKGRWNVMISQAQCDLPYAYSWWLDVVCPRWEALVSEDYAFIMPLPLNIKYGVKYLVHPVWVQQLGIYSSKEVTPEIFNDFIKEIPYLIYDFNINYTNWNSSIERKTNLIIPHNSQIDLLRKGYNKNTRRNIGKANKSELNIAYVDPVKFVELWKNENIDKQHLLIERIEPLVNAALNNQTERFKVHLLGVYERESLIAALFGVQTKSRFIYLIPVSNERGKACCAMFKLVDYVLDNICCRKGLVFDCEGSMISGVARFYNGLGAVEQTYGVIRRCHPTKLVKLIHKFI